jgi:aryl-alcohol dehydrogenase-like predicted oxidoreductase
VIDQVGVTAAIAGSRNPEHTRANAAAGSLRLDAAAAARLDELFS